LLDRLNQAPIASLPRSKPEAPEREPHQPLSADRTGKAGRATSAGDQPHPKFGQLDYQIRRSDAPGGLAVPCLVSANRQCHLLAARDGWIALNLAREEDREAIPALIGGNGDLLRAVAAMTASEFRDRAIELQLPVAVVGEAAPEPLVGIGGKFVPRRVIDLSALWAGPLCAGLLARAGAEVLRIESLGRPDLTPIASPQLDSFINGGKVRLPLDLRSETGRARLLAEIEQADVVVTSARPAALARLGLTQLRFPHLTWVAITAHGFTSPAANRVGFGDDCAAAGKGASRGFLVMPWPIRLLGSKPRLRCWRGSTG
jgi:hypothetical protein